MLKYYIVAIILVIIAVVLLVLPTLPPRKPKEAIETIDMVHQLGGQATCANRAYVTFLDLSLCNLVDDRMFSDLFRINGLKNLWHLDLSNTKITGASLVHCESMPLLSFLNLSGTGVSPDEIDCFVNDHPKITVVK